jgi:hypothetical protein
MILATSARHHTKEILGWDVTVNRAEGMKITYDYFDQD